MSNFKGKRMVDEDLIKKLRDLQPGGGGGEYTAGEGISIDENNEISANIKAGSGIVVDTDLTDDSLVVMIDQEDIPYKSDLATVATTGDYDDLTNKPTVAEPDEKTIIVNGSGKLETAIGGSKEVNTIYGCILPGSTVGDWDLIDSTIANAMFSELEANVSYDVTLTLLGGKFPKEITSAVISSPDKTSDKYGGSGALVITDEDSGVHTWEFYVDISSNQIHVWPNDNWVATAGTKLVIDFESSSGMPTDSYTVYEPIESGFIEHTFNYKSSTLTSDEYNYIIDNLKTIAIIAEGDYYYLASEGANYAEFLCTRNAIKPIPGDCQVEFTNIYLDKEQKYLSLETRRDEVIKVDDSTITMKVPTYGERVLTTIIGGGYSDSDIPVVYTDFTLNGSNYVCTNTTFQNAFLKTVDYLYRTYSWGGTSLAFINSNNDIAFFSYEVTASQSSGVYTYTVDCLATGYNTFSYDSNTDTYTISNIEFKNDIVDFMQNNSIAYFKNKYPQGPKIVEPIDSKFIPIDNNSITLDASGNLQAAAAIPYTFTNGLTETSGTVGLDTMGSFPGIKIEDDPSNPHVLFQKTGTGFPMSNVTLGSLDPSYIFNLQALSAFGQSVPTTAGTYTLSVTIAADGTPTFSWT